MFLILLRVLSVLRASVVNGFRGFYHHGETEHTEVGRGKRQDKIFPTDSTSGGAMFIDSGASNHEFNQ